MRLELCAGHGTDDRRQKVPHDGDDAVRSGTTGERRKRIEFGAIVSLLLILAGSPASAQPKSAASAQRGSVPLSDVLVVAKAYPNLVTQVRLRLVATGQKADKVVCTAQRLDNRWSGLSGARLAPYVCPIGKRTLTITATPTWYDKAGYKLKANDSALAAKAAKVVEARLQWSWK